MPLTSHLHRQHRRTLLHCHTYPVLFLVILPPVRIVAPESPTTERVIPNSSSGTSYLLEHGPRGPYDPMGRMDLMDLVHLMDLMKRMDLLTSSTSGGPPYHRPQRPLGPAPRLPCGPQELGLGPRLGIGLDTELRFGFWLGLEGLFPTN